MINNERASGKKIIAGISWTFAERITTHIAGFVVSVVLARILEPSVYGILALANIFISIMNSISLTGFGPSLIQKKEATIEDFSTTLYFSFFIGLLSYTLLFVTAPLIASFFKVVGLAAVIRVGGLILISASINVIQRAYLIRNLQFNKLFLSSLFDSALSAVVGVLLAIRGFGVWALVAQMLVKSITDVLLLSFISDFRPRLVFSVSIIKDIYKYGWKIIAASLLDSIYEQSRSAVVGKMYSENDLAYYDKGMQFPALLINNVDTTIASVLISALSREQDDVNRVKALVRKSLKVSSFVLFPLLIGMMACSKEIVQVLLTDKWLPSVPYMQLLCVAFMFKPIQTASLQGILAIGRSDLYLKVRCYQKIIGISVLIISASMWNNTLAIAAGELVSYVLFMLIIMLPNIKCLNYSLSNQLLDLIPQLVVAVLMGISVYVLGTLLKGIPYVAMLVIQIGSGALIYLGFSILLKVPAMREIVEVLSMYLRRNLKES